MRYYFLLLTVFVFSFSSLSAQSTKYIEIEDFNTRIDVLTFQVYEVVDQRKEKQEAWTLKEGGLRTSPLTLKFKEDLESTLKSVINNMIPPDEEAKKLQLVIHELELGERAFDDYVLPYFIIKASFVHQGDTLATERVSVTKRKGHTSYVFKNYVEEGIEELLIQFVDNYGYPNDYAISNPEKFIAKRDLNRNVLSIGYQIGGWTLVGAQYEIRVSDHIGMNVGLGLRGYSFGFSYLFTDRRQSGFLNLSLRDGGFGLLHTVNLDLGFRIPISQLGIFGFHLQFGIAHVIDIDRGIGSRLDIVEKRMIFSFGAGVCFW